MRASGRYLQASAWTALVILIALACAHPVLAAGANVAAARVPIAQAETHPAAAAQEHGEASAGETPHAKSIWATIARLVNFGIMVGVLVYFLRAPIASYLARRSTEIRADLTKAAETSEAASRELATIEQKMRSLPAEIETLKARGAEDIAAEETRIKQAADTERERLLEQTRREIDLQLRAAERELRKEAADLTVRLAGDRIKQTITDADQVRLVDRYLAQVQK